MNEIVKHIEFATVKRPLRNYRAQMVFNLIADCLNSRKILDDYVLQDWWMEKFVKPRNRMHHEWTGKRDKDGEPLYIDTPEYDYYSKLINKYNGLLPGYYWMEAKQSLKYHIGNLVVNGYLIVLPVIKISETNELNNEQL